MSTRRGNRSWYSQYSISRDGDAHPMIRVLSRVCVGAGHEMGAVARPGRLTHAGIQAAGLLHAVSSTAQPEPGAGPRAQHGVGPALGHARRAQAERRRRLDRRRPAQARLRAHVRVHASRLRRACARLDHRLVRLGLLLRRPLPRALQTHPVGRHHPARAGVPRPARTLHDAWEGRIARAEQPGRGGAERPMGPHHPGDVRRMAHPLHHEHPQPHGRVDVGAHQHRHRPRRQPHRVHAHAPQGRWRPLVGEPRRVRGGRGDPGHHRRHATDGGALRHVLGCRAPAKRSVFVPARGAGGG